MSKGDAEHAAQHQHGVQVSQTGTVDTPVTNARIVELEKRVEDLETKVEAKRVADLETKAEA